MRRIMFLLIALGFSLTAQACFLEEPDEEEPTVLTEPAPDPDPTPEPDPTPTPDPDPAEEDMGDEEPETQPESMPESMPGG